MRRTPIDIPRQRIGDELERTQWAEEPAFLSKVPADAIDA
jgi:hypothetical protein